jgi:hypothetical protein
MSDAYDILQDLSLDNLSHHDQIFYASIYLLFRGAALQSFVVFQAVAFHVSCEELAVAALGVVVVTGLTQMVLKLLPGVAACISVVMSLTLMILKLLTQSVTAGVAVMMSLTLMILKLLIQSVTAGVAVMMSLILMILKLLIHGVTVGVVVVASLSLIQMLLKFLIHAYPALLHELQSKSGQG